MSLSSNSRYILSVATGLLYGLAIRLIEYANIHHSPGPGSRFYPNDLWVMTAGFLVVVPFVMGWLTTSSAPADKDFHWPRWVFLPWTTIVLMNLAVFLTLIEGAICIVMALPIALVVSSLGGIAGGLAARGRYLRGRSTTLCLAVLPLLLSAIEMQSTAPLQLRTVETSIRIHAPAATVWDNIKRVPSIRPNEIRRSWTHRIGFPLPLEATLDRDGVGGIRHATFERGLLFIETVTTWRPEDRLAFTIAADTAHIPPGTLDDHVTIGGRYFDVLDGEYRLEPLSKGDILLHLSSRERVSTDFNAYAGLWTDAVMRDLQQSILEVVQHRCETSSATVKR